MTDFSIALGMVVAAAVLVGLFLWFKAHSSEQRMVRMIERSGLNPEIAKQHGHATTVGQARQRCRNCQSEDICERWLKGKIVGDNEFCPNAHVFEGLKQGSVPHVRVPGVHAFFF